MNFINKETIISACLLFFSNDAIVFCAPTANEIAQQERIASQQDQYDEARRREEEQKGQINAPSVKLQEEKKLLKNVQLPDEEIGFHIDRIIVESPMLAKFSFTQKLVKPYENRKIGIQGINLLAQMLTENIMARGYVTTTVTLPEQDMTSGTLIFSVVPGKLAAYALKNHQCMVHGEMPFPPTQVRYSISNRLSRALSR